jgi:hypothetical protein
MLAVGDGLLAGRHLRLGPGCGVRAGQLATVSLIWRPGVRNKTRGGGGRGGGGGGGGGGSGGGGSRGGDADVGRKNPPREMFKGQAKGSITEMLRVTHADFTEGCARPTWSIFHPYLVFTLCCCHRLLPRGSHCCCTVALFTSYRPVCLVLFVLLSVVSLLVHLLCVCCMCVVVSLLVHLLCVCCMCVVVSLLVHMLCVCCMCVVVSLLVHLLCVCRMRVVVSLGSCLLWHILGDAGVLSTDAVPGAFFYIFFNVYWEGKVLNYMYPTSLYREEG